MTLKRFLLPTFALIATSFGTQVKAAISFSFSVDQSEIMLGPGQRTSVSLSFVQTGDFTLASQNGLQALNFWVRREDATSVFPNPARIDTDASSINSASFGTLFVNDASASNFDVTLMRPFGQSSGPSGSALALATLEIVAGTTLGNTYFQVLDNPFYDETITYGNNIALDAYISPATFAVIVIPEPASLSILMLTASVLIRRLPSQRS